MKFQGLQLLPPEPKVLVVPHNGVDVVFKAQCVTDYAEFDALVPTPVPVKMRMADGSEKVDTEDKDFRKECDDYARLRSDWMFVKSLQASEGLEWSRVHPQKPETWRLIVEELQETGFTLPVIERIKMLCFVASGLDQTLIDEATERFLAGRDQESDDEISQTSDQ